MRCLSPNHGAITGPVLQRAWLAISQLATTSAYLHARPGESSARFLTVESKAAAKGKNQMPNATKKATAAPQARRVATGKAGRLRRPGT
jgi:hypothetical protein